MSIVPGSRPKQTREETEAILSARGVDFTTKVALLGIRGYYADSMGRPGENDQAMYDDALVVIGPGVYQTFNFNTDPQKAGHRKAMLDAGLYDFYKGKHKNKYNALRPYPEGVSLPCTRDGVRSMCGLTNIHKGGFRDTFSEGCQTIYPTQYDPAMSLIYAEMTKHGQKTIKYLLIDGTKSEKFEAPAPAAVRDLKIGDEGEDVKRLQTALKLKADGIFGRGTRAAVIAAQSNAGLRADGIVGAKTRHELDL